MITKLESLSGRDYLSYSSFTSYLDCSERWRLERVLNAPQGTGWWLIGGSAVHSATEWLDKGDDRTPSGAFAAAWVEEVERALARGVNEADIRAGGRKTNQWPDKENKDWWLANGPAMVQGWVNWRQARFAEGWSFVTMGEFDGIEVPFDTWLGEVRIKGYIDRLMVNPDGQVVVLDLKSGSSAPTSSLQLGVYKVALEKTLGISPSVGTYYMTRKEDTTEQTSLLHYTPDVIGDWFAAAKRSIEAEIFIPHVTHMCATCMVAPYCKAVGGDDTPLQVTSSN